MNDTRSISEIVKAHPVPWSPVTAPGFENGMARIIMLDRLGKEVELFTLLRVIQLVSNKLSTGTSID